MVVKVRESNMGEIMEGIEFSSKSKTNFNHKIEWKKLNKQSTEGKPFNYYPRGRVELVAKKH